MNSGVEVARRKRQCATVRGDEPRVTPESASPDIRARIPQGVQRDVAADEVAREPLGDVESGPAVTAADFQEAAAGGRGQGVAQRVCLFDGRESVQADFMAEDDALNPPRHLASALGIPLPEAVDRVRLSHSSMISTDGRSALFARSNTDAFGHSVPGSGGRVAPPGHN